MNNQRDELPPEAMTALWQGNKIEAIKILRQARNIGLKDAKDKIETYVKNDPALQHKLATAHAEATRGLVRWLIIFAVLAIAGYYFLISG
jgi:ribosomal protein L7/L12